MFYRIISRIYCINTTSYDSKTMLTLSNATAIVVSDINESYGDNWRIL